MHDNAGHFTTAYYGRTHFSEMHIEEPPSNEVVRWQAEPEIRTSLAEMSAPRKEETP
jgi:hypothetical protein